MTLNDYQKIAHETTVYPDKSDLIYLAVGLTSEAGKVADRIKKIYRDNNKEFNINTNAEIGKNIGDVLWYIAEMSNMLGFSLNDIAVANIHKIQYNINKK